MPNRMWLYKFARRAPVLIIDEFRTSKLCHQCHGILGPDRLTEEGQRLKACATCSIDVERDVNAAENIKQVTWSYLTTYTAPWWQSRTLDLNTIKSSEVEDTVSSI